MSQRSALCTLWRQTQNSRTASALADWWLRSTRTSTETRGKTDTTGWMSWGKQTTWPLNRHWPSRYSGNRLTDMVGATRAISSCSTVVRSCKASGTAAGSMLFAAVNSVGGLEHLWEGVPNKSVSASKTANTCKQSGQGETLKWDRGLTSKGVTASRTKQGRRMTVTVHQVVKLPTRRSDTTRTQPPVSHAVLLRHRRKAQCQQD